MTKSLCEATRDVLLSQGTDILNSPNRFTACVTDDIGPESVEARALYIGCDERMLAPFSEAIREGTPGAIDGAVHRTAEYLHSEWLIDTNVAFDVSSQIGEGIALARGIALPPMRQGSAAVQHTAYASADVTQTSGYGMPMTQQQPMPRQPMQGGDIYSTGTVPPPQPTPYAGAGMATQTAPAKKSSGKIVAVIVGVAALAIVAVVAMGVFRSKPSSKDPQETVISQTDDKQDQDDTETPTTDKPDEPVDSPNDDGVTTDSGEEPSEGTLSGLSYEWISVTDNNRGDMKMVFVHNNNTYPVRVDDPDGLWLIYSLAPGNDGCFLISSARKINSDITVSSTEDSSPASWCTWTETSREDNTVWLNVHNYRDSNFTFVNDFYFVLRNNDEVTYMSTSWTSDSTGKKQDTLYVGDNTFHYDGYGDYACFTGDYDLYIDGVLVPKG